MNTEEHSMVITPVSNITEVHIPEGNQGVTIHNQTGGRVMVHLPNGHTWVEPKDYKRFNLTEKKMKQNQENETLEPRVPKLMPLPWPKEKDFRTTGVVQLECNLTGTVFSLERKGKTFLTEFHIDGTKCSNGAEYFEIIQWIENIRNNGIQGFINPDSIFNESDVKIIEKFAWDSAEDYMKAGVNPDQNGPNRYKTKEEVICYMDGYYHAMKCVRDAMRLPEEMFWKITIPGWFWKRFPTEKKYRYSGPLDHALADSPVAPTPPPRKEYKSVNISIGDTSEYIAELMNDGWEPDRVFGVTQMFSRLKSQE